MENSNQTWNTLCTSDELFMTEEEENLKHKYKILQVSKGQCGLKEHSGYTSFDERRLIPLSWQHMAQELVIIFCVVHLHCSVNFNSAKCLNCPASMVCIVSVFCLASIFCDSSIIRCSAQKPWGFVLHLASE